MMAMLWAQQIMLGKKTYAQVPRLLKDKVKEVLIDSGLEERSSSMDNIVSVKLDSRYAPTLGGMAV